jgi:hypothetical protein
MTRDSRGAVVILFDGCPGEAVKTIGLYREGPGGQDTTLWEIKSTTPVSDVRIAVGEVPDGFRETFPLTEAVLPPDVSHVVEVKALTTPASKFRPSQLLNGKVLTRAKLVSEQEFHQRAEAVCSKA